MRCFKIINLISKDYLLKKEYLFQRGKLIFALIVLGFILLGLSYRNNNQLDYLIQQVDGKKEVNQKLLSQKEKLLFWQQKLQKRDEYKNDVKQLADGIAYDKLLAELNSLLAPDLRLKQLSIDDGRIILTGQSLSERAVTDSLARLKSSSVYSDFKIINLKIEEEINFALEGVLK